MHSQTFLDGVAFVLNLATVAVFIWAVRWLVKSVSAVTQLRRDLAALVERVEKLQGKAPAGERPADTYDIGHTTPAWPGQRRPTSRP